MSSTSLTVANASFDGGDTKGYTGVGSQQIPTLYIDTVHCSRSSQVFLFTKATAKPRSLSKCTFFMPLYRMYVQRGGAKVMGITRLATATYVANSSGFAFLAKVGV